MAAMLFLLAAVQILTSEATEQAEAATNTGRQMRSYPFENQPDNQVGGRDDTGIIHGAPTYVAGDNIPQRDTYAYNSYGGGWDSGGKQKFVDGAAPPRKDEFYYQPSMGVSFQTKAEAEAEAAKLNCPGVRQKDDGSWMPGLYDGACKVTGYTALEKGIDFEFQTEALAAGIKMGCEGAHKKATGRWAPGATETACDEVMKPTRAWHPMCRQRTVGFKTGWFIEFQNQFYPCCDANVAGNCYADNGPSRYHGGYYSTNEQDNQ